jgi:hypothetical protein
MFRRSKSSEPFNQRIMKPALIICSLLVALHVCHAAEKEESLAEIHKEREAVLKAIVAEFEHEASLGRGKSENLAEAQIDLLRFRIERATDVTEKKAHQRKIVAIVQALYSTVEMLSRENRVEGMKVLKVKERLLAEKQRLLEM